MQSTVFADIGRGGHRHLHVRFLFDHIFQHRRADLIKVWFYITSDTADAVAGTLGSEAAMAFRSRLILAKPTLSPRIAFNHVMSAARSVLASHVLFLEIDPFVYILSFGRIPVAVSGVWFRPNFHYDRAGLLHEGSRQKAVAAFKRVVAGVLCSKSQIVKLFVFDRWAAEHDTAGGRRNKLQYVPDPMAFPASGLRPTRQSDRYVIGIIGSVSRRKGLFSVLGALRRLTAAEQCKIELRIVGRVNEAENARLNTEIQRTRDDTAVRIVQINNFVSDEDIDIAIAGSDLILLVYQKFIGSSGILIRAALHGRPVLATRYGLVGGLVNRYDLGLTVDPYNEEQISQGIRRMLGREVFYVSENAQRFAAEHSPEAYVNSLSNAACDDLRC